MFRSTAMLCARQFLLRHPREWLHAIFRDPPAGTRCPWKTIIDTRSLTLTLFLGTIIPCAFLHSDEPDDPHRILRQGEQLGRDRRLPVWTSECPWRCVGQIRTGNGSMGTGSLIGRDIVLTNAHVILKDRSSRRIDWPIHFYPGYAKGPSKYTSRAHSAVFGRSCTGTDYAILKLRSPLGDSLGWVGLAMRPLSALTAWKDKLFLIGYSSDLYNGEVCSHFIGANILGSAGRADWRHDCDALPGSFGSGLMYTSGGSVKIVAIHWGGLDPTFDDELCVPVSTVWTSCKGMKPQHKAYEYTTYHVVNKSRHAKL